MAGLGLSIDASETGLTLELPEIYQKFSLTQKAEEFDNSAFSAVLKLQIFNAPLPKNVHLKEKLCQVELWELWKNSRGDLTFYLPCKPPLRWLLVDQDFQKGSVYGDFSSLGKNPFYPLPVIDIVLYSNWLAKYNDLMLHAAGIAVDGQGYGFIGESGQGKSTLMRDLMSLSGVTVLGEDQIILRYLNDQFWIFGTPWHTDPDRCSPISVPLKKLFFLNRGEKQTIIDVVPFDGITKIMRTAFVPYYRHDAVSGILDRLGLLAEQVPFFTLSYHLGAAILPHILSA